MKMSPGFFDNPKIGLPSLNGLMVVFSARTGLVEAILLDNGYLTDVRTAAAGGVAADRLARRSEEHTSELQSLMRISYAVFCLKKKKQHTSRPPATHAHPTTPHHYHTTHAPTVTS